MSKTIGHISNRITGPKTNSAGLGTAMPADYYALMKPRVMSLVVFTAMVGYICAASAFEPFLALASIFCIAVGAGAAGALNMWYDRDIDALMTRTRKRPIPSGRISSSSALGFGVVMSIIAVIGLSMAANYLAAGLLGFTIFYYFIIYTVWLKRSTAQNIVIGGVAGALPPLVGWAAAGGGISLESVLLFLIIFLWTPPHFWALALYKQTDYAKAGIPMMPNVKGARSTRVQIFVYALLLAGVCALLVKTELWSAPYAVIATVANAGFVYLACRVLISRAGDDIKGLGEASLYKVKNGERAARNLFAFSIVYLFVIFAAIAIGKVI